MTIEVKRLRPGDERAVRGCLHIAENRYPAFDRDAAFAWACDALHKDEVAILVTEHCFVVVVVYQRPWSPAESYADLVLLCSGRHDKRSAGELLALARACKAFAVEKGCVRLDFAPETGVDLGPLARRIGGAEPKRQVGWMVRLSDG